MFPEPPTGPGGYNTPPSEKGLAALIPDIPSIGWILSPMHVAWIAAGFALIFIAIRMRRPQNFTPAQPKKKTPIEDKLTYLVAGAVSLLSAQGMYGVLIDAVHLPEDLAAVFCGFLEAVALICALRARRNMRESEDGDAGPEGRVLWLIATLSAVVLAMHADSLEAGLLRFSLPFIATWLWDRGLKIERRKRTGRKDSTISLRITPDRILVWLRLADPKGREAWEVDAQRRITLIAKRSKALRDLQDAGAKPEDITKADEKLNRAVIAAVEHAGLAGDGPEGEKLRSALLAQLSLMYNARHLAKLNVDAPWAGLVQESPKTFFEAQGLSFTPAQLTLPSPVSSAIGPDLSDLLTAQADRSGDRSRVRSGDRSQSGPKTGPESGPKTGPGSDGGPVSGPVPGPMADRSRVRSGVRSETGLETGPKSVRRSGPRRASAAVTDDFDGLVARAKEINAKHVAKHEKNISVEELRTKLRCAKPTATRIHRLAVRGEAL